MTGILSDCCFCDIPVTDDVMFKLGDAGVTVVVVTVEETTWFLTGDSVATLVAIVDCCTIGFWTLGAGATFKENLATPSSWLLSKAVLPGGALLGDEDIVAFTLAATADAVVDKLWPTA